MKMSYEEIRKYVDDNNEPHLKSEELDHVTMCMEHIVKWYYEDCPLGSFLTAIVGNDFIGVVFQADDVNLRALKLYAWFLTWNLPADWRKKGMEQGS